MNKLTLMMLSVLLLGCQVTTAPIGAPTAEPLPSNYRQQISDRVRQTFFDPYSIQDAEISQPIPGVAFTGNVATVCLRANSKNQMGAYTGLKTTSFTFREGQITAADSEYAGVTCHAAVYGPFPDLNADYKPPKAARHARRP